MNIAGWLRSRAELHPTAPALFSGGEQIVDYAGLAARAAACAERLRELGLGPGDRAALFMRNRPEYLEWLYGVLWLGAAAVPVNAKLHGGEAAWILANAEVGAVIADGAGAAVLGAAPNDAVLVDAEQVRPRPSQADAAPAAREWEDLAWLFYTSGTTGRPKGVRLSHGNLIAMSLSYLADVDQVATGDCALYAAPLSHGAGLYTFVHTLAGARHAVPASGGFDADEVLDLAAALGDVSMFAAPTMVRRLVAATRRRGERGEGLKTIVYGGGPMYLADIEEAIEAMGHRFVQIYGQGESPMTITCLAREQHGEPNHPRHRQRLASVGRPHSVAEVRIADATGTPLGAGEVGEVQVRGVTVMSGYWRNPEATAEALEGGWLHTGDVGSLDSDGFLTLSDRAKDVIISGGTNIYPREVEEVLLAHPAVREAAVVGLPDREWGERLIACLVLDPGAGCEDSDLDRHCLQRMARFKRPREYVRLEALPANHHGKLDRRALREAVESRPGAGR